MKRVITAMLCFVVLLCTMAVLAPTIYAASMDSAVGIVTTQNYSLNIRSGMSTASTIIGTAKKGSYLMLLKREGQWWMVEYAKGKYEYTLVIDLDGYAIYFYDRESEK